MDKDNNLSIDAMIIKAFLEGKDEIQCERIINALTRYHQGVPTLSNSVKDTKEDQ